MLSAVNRPFYGKSVKNKIDAILQSIDSMAEIQKRIANKVKIEQLVAETLQADALAPCATDENMTNLADAL